ncbi:MULTISPECIES: hypothetical protein [Acinetobacter]|uniref:Zinc-finger domain-containing protein n=1 Tax=Acinetobacter pollinis TaxID=2605270 RepID=A0ABU6DRC0_9GAMM|nr:MULTISPECIES: hypothetical protein [Acinetobacter]MCF9035293.1 hypothetical protein [Acinetobacter nectaris]MEB5475958.1 hypothetical protein [Acinetobacter pollinis]
MKNKNDQQTVDWCEDLFGLTYKQEIKHGTVTAYKKHKCRCEFCIKAKELSDQRAELRKVIKAQAQQVGVV